MKSINSTPPYRWNIKPWAWLILQILLISVNASMMEFTKQERISGVVVQASELCLFEGCVP
jgi:hypothetical protein